MDFKIQRKPEVLGATTIPSPIYLGDLGNLVTGDVVLSDVNGNLYTSNYDNLLGENGNYVMAASTAILTAKQT